MTVVGAGPRRCDRVAERARGGRRGRLGPAARAGAAAAQRPARVLLAPRARGLPPARARRARGAAEGAARPVVSAGRRRGTSRSRAPPPRAASGSSARVNGSEQVICATGFLRGFRTTRCSRASSTSTGSRRSKAGSCSRPTRPCPALTDAHADARARGRAGAVGVPGRRHARRRALRRARLPAEDQGMSYTLRGRIESRLAALVPVVAAACALALRPAPLVAGRGGRADGRRRARARHAGLRPAAAATSRAGRRVPLGAARARRPRSALMRAPRRSWRRSGRRSALFAGGWLLAQLLGHAGFPLLRLGYAEDGGELGRLGGVSARRGRRSSLAGAAGDRLRAGAAGRPPAGGRLPGAARDHAARGARSASPARSSAAASSSRRTT